MVEINPIAGHQDDAIRQIIQTVGAEFGAVGEGFGPSDDEVSAMSQHYNDANRSQYLVATVDGRVVGGSGVAGFASGEGICELRKLFLLPDWRGQGIGRALTVQCLNYARRQGYRTCYLDTLSTMSAAIGLYQSLGFERLNHPLAGTLHNGCDVWMLKPL